MTTKPAATAKTIEQYALGDELFRYVTGGGMFRFLVVGIRQYEGETQLEVESQTCTHGRKCRLLLAKNDYGRIVHVHMLNEDEDDRQRHWHQNEGLHFWPTVDQAKLEQLRRMKSQAEESVRKAQDALSAAKKRLAEWDGLIDSEKEKEVQL